MITSEPMISGWAYAAPSTLAVHDRRTLPIGGELTETPSRPEVRLKVGQSALETLPGTLTRPELPAAPELPGPLVDFIELQPATASSAVTVIAPIGRQGCDLTQPILNRPLDIVKYGLCPSFAVQIA